MWLVLTFVVSIHILILSSAIHAHNITQILSEYPEFSAFNRYLTITHVAAEINRRQTITVLAVDNTGMAGLLSKHLSVYTIKNVLSLHVLVDYFDAKKLHRLNNGTISIASTFQSAGSAPGSFGYINITDLKADKIGFATENDEGEFNAFFVKSVRQVPYNISIIQISQVLSSPDAVAPAPVVNLNLMNTLDKQDCTSFADLLSASGAKKTFEDNLGGGLTVFCPSDTVINGFMTTYKNLAEADRVQLLLYHGVPEYQSTKTLMSSDGVMNTLATDEADEYDFSVQNDGENVTLDTEVTTAKITGTLVDKRPLVVYEIDKVLLPKELFKANLTEIANGAVGFNGWRLVVVFLSLCSGVLFIQINV